MTSHFSSSSSPSLLDLFSSPSAAVSPRAASTCTLPSAPAPPFRKAVLKQLRIPPFAISGHPLSPPTLLFSSLSSYSLCAAFHRTPCLRVTLNQEAAVVGEDVEDDESYEEEDVDSEDVGRSGEAVGGDGVLVRLSVKEKKELASYANSLGKKLKSQLVGKSGVTESVGRSFVETLEANELLKIKIHRTCPGELEDVVKRLEMLTGSVVVGQIGRTVIIYRPSITKMKAEEEKNKRRRIFRRRAPSSGFTPLKNKAVTSSDRRGRRGSFRTKV